MAIRYLALAGQPRGLDAESPFAVWEYALPASIPPSEQRHLCRRRASWRSSPSRPGYLGSGPDPAASKVGFAVCEFVAFRKTNKANDR